MDGHFLSHLSFRSIWMCFHQCILIHERFHDISHASLWMSWLALWFLFSVHWIEYCKVCCTCWLLDGRKVLWRGEEYFIYNHWSMESIHILQWNPFTFFKGIHSHSSEKAIQWRKLDFLHCQPIHMITINHHWRFSASINQWILLLRQWLWINPSIPWLCPDLN